MYEKEIGIFTECMSGVTEDGKISLDILIQRIHEHSEYLSNYCFNLSVSEFSSEGNTKGFGSILCYNSFLVYLACEIINRKNKEMLEPSIN